MAYGTASKMGTGLFREFSGAVLRSLPDDLDPTTVQGWIENQASLRNVLREALSPLSVSGSTLSIWKTIKLGTGPKTAKDFIRTLKNDGCRVSDWAADIIGKPAFSVSDKAVEVDLVKVTMSELGFPNGATVCDIYEAALKRGLVRCPSEVGPQLRLQYKDQPYGEWLRIGMEPITVSGGNLFVFSVGHDGDGRWLSGGDGRPGDFWSGDSQWVFVRPRK